MMNKKAILKSIKKQLQDAFAQLETDVERTRESMFDETKNSAGDKYETGREMIRQELDKLEQSLMNTRKKIDQVESLENKMPSTQITQGSLILTDKAIFWLGIALGKVQVEGETIMCISPEAPLSAVFRGIMAGDQVDFLQQSYFIKEVL